MNTLKTIICGLLVVSTSLALAQSRSNPKPIPPELLAKYEQASKAIDRGQQHLKNDQIDEAIAAFREAVAIYDSVPGFTSSGNYELAKALTKAGRTEEALATYRKAVLWDSNRKDFRVIGSHHVQVIMDYAILLARSGKEEDAKVVYYSGLRMFNLHESSRYEPFPFLVVFDPDPTMTVWEYTPERLIAAVKMAKAPDVGGDERQALVDEVRLMEPNWILPVVYKASRRSGQWRTHYIDLAMSLARNEEERTWVREMHADDEPQEIGRNRRLASTVLNEAKLDLAQNHHRSAVCECAGGH